MKNYISYLLVAMTLVFATSCEDEDKNPLPTPPFGAFAYIEITNALVDASNPSSAFSGTIVAPGENLASYDLSVSIDGTNFGSLETITSFPADISYTLADIEGALGLSPGSVQPGDQITFSAVITDNDGNVATIDNLSGDALNPGQRQAFEYTAFVFCPFNQADALGTYDTVNDSFGLAADTFEVTAGPTETSIVINNLIQDGLNLTLEVDPATGAFSIDPRQPAADAFFGYSGGNINTSGSSNFVFSCVGVITASFQYTVDLGSFGSFGFVAQKQ